MTVCPTCHLQEPCWCDGRPSTPRPRAANRVTPHAAAQPHVRASRWVRAGARCRDVPAAGGTCPLEHAGDVVELEHDRYVCRACTARLRGLLRHLPDLMGDLDVALTGQVRFTAQRGSSQPRRPDVDDAAWPQTAAVTPLPYAAGPAEAGWVLRDTVLANLEWILDVRGHHVPTTWTDVATYLTAALDWVARHPDGPQVIDELTAGLRQAWRAIDRPADQHYLGLCPGTLVDLDGLATACTYPLYGADSAATVTCPRCLAPWAVADLHTALVARIEHHQLAAVDAERVLATVGIDIPARLIRLWKHRGELEVAGVDARGRPLYEVGAILARNAVSDPGGTVAS